MSSPAKKRKKNDHNASNQPVKSLDFFFAKQAERIKQPPPPAIEEQPVEGAVDIEETDEQIAKRLQEEFDREYQETNNEAPKLEPVAKKEVQDEVAPLPLLSPSIPAIQTLALQTGVNSTSDQYTNTIPLTDSPLTFSPSTYITTLRSYWPSNSQATYALLVHAFVLINATASRIKIVDTLTNLVRLIIEADPESLLPAVWLSTNAISPPYISLELGLGGSAISKALTRTSNLDAKGLRALSSQLGDPGDVAFEAKKRSSFTLRKPTPLTIQGVYDSLVAIAEAKGTGSQEIKQRIVERLIRDARGPEEARYLVRTLAQHLRIGAVKATMLTALARAFLLSKPTAASFDIQDTALLSTFSKEKITEVYARAEETVKSCFAQHPNYATLVPALLECGVDLELKARCGLSMHIPLRPMLGSITRDLGDMFTRVHGREFTAEYKYDGQRAQVHCSKDGKVSVFSRHLENMTGQYPDLVALVPSIRGDGVQSFILEGEVVAMDENGEVRPFQQLAGRARSSVNVGDVKVQVCLFAFDLMYLNEESLLERSLRERRELLRSMFTEIPLRFTWVKSMDATEADSDAVLEFFNTAVSQKCEGIMVKVLDNPPISEIEKAAATLPTDPITPTKPASKPAKGKTKKSATTTAADTAQAKPGSRRKLLLATYEPDKRLDSWLKVKKDYHATADTLDLVPIGAWHGSGRKSAWWSPVLLAAYSPDSGRLVAVTKCISGFTDSFYKEMREKYDPDGPNIAASRPAFVEYVGEPTFWFEPQEVWEIAFADVTLSPTYTAGIEQVGGERGLSLRFPRFLKKREDKGIEEASSEEFLADLYWKQLEKAPQKGGEDGDGDDNED
jgi:DNA ligase-1